MRKTGWDPPPLMQDDNPQLSQWFASRPDARYVFKRNQRREKMKRLVEILKRAQSLASAVSNDEELTLGMLALADGLNDELNELISKFDPNWTSFEQSHEYDPELTEIAMTLIKNAKYVVRNHNGTLLGTFSHKEDAEKDAKEYRYQTGNAAYIEEK